MFSCNEKYKGLILKALLVICLSALHLAAQPTADLQKLLQEKAGLTQIEMSDLERGKPVVKLLPSKEVREISVLGIIRLNNVLDMDPASFREGLSQRGAKGMLDSGTFGRPPTPADIAELVIDEKDIEDLGRCIVGNCNVKLSAEMIRRIRQIDWGASDHKQQAVELYKELLVEKVRAYSESGDRALIEYADQRKSVDLRQVYPSLLERSVFIKHLAPEFENYLKGFPKTQNDGIEDRIEWSRVKSGLKPIITIMHSSTYDKKTDDGPQIMLVTKQIYASHYIDALLALSALINTRVAGQAGSYLLFTNISYSESLGGALGRMAHPVVEREAIEKVTDLLLRGSAQINAKTRASGEVDPAPPGASGSLPEVLKRYWFIWAIGAAILVFWAFQYIRRRRGWA